MLHLQNRNHIRFCLTFYEVIISKKIIQIEMMLMSPINQHIILIMSKTNEY